LASDDGYIATKNSQTAVQLVFGSAACALQSGAFAPPPSLILLMFVRCVAHLRRRRCGASG
jgi:hypothetical protein